MQALTASLFQKNWRNSGWRGRFVLCALWQTQERAASIAQDDKDGLVGSGAHGRPYPMIFCCRIQNALPALSFSSLFSTYSTSVYIYIIYIYIQFNYIILISHRWSHLFENKPLLQSSGYGNGAVMQRRMILALPPKLSQSLKFSHKPCFGTCQAAWARKSGLRRELGLTNEDFWLISDFEFYTILVSLKYFLACFRVVKFVFLERYSADHNRVIESAFRTGVGCLACVVFVQRSNGCWCSWSWNPRLRKQTSLLEFAATKFSSKVPPCMESRQGDVRFQAATWECDGE